MAAVIPVASFTWNAACHASNAIVSSSSPTLSPTLNYSIVVPIAVSDVPLILQYQVSAGTQVYALIQNHYMTISSFNTRAESITNTTVLCCVCGRSEEEGRNGTERIISDLRSSYQAGKTWMLTLNYKNTYCMSLYSSAIRTSAISGYNDRGCIGYILCIG